MQKKVLIIATIPGFFRHMRTVTASMKRLGYRVDAATNFQRDSYVDFSEYHECHQIDIRRFPLSGTNLRAYRQLCKLINEGKYDIVFCNTPAGGVLGRLAARKSRRLGTRVIYMAHGFHFYSGAPLRYWLLFYPIEWACSWMTDALITINHEDYDRALRRLHANKTFYVPGVGVDTARFVNPSADTTLRHSLGMQSHEHLLLSVGELNENKHHQVIVHALTQLDNVHYAIAGTGAKEEQLRYLAAKMGLEDRLHLLGYRHDIPQLYATADAFVLPSLREGLNVSLMEALVSGLPCVCRRMRGNIDLIHDGVNGCLVSGENPDDWAHACLRALELRQEGGCDNHDEMRSFSAEAVEERMLEILIDVTKNGDS